MPDLSQLSDKELLNLRPTGSKLSALSDEELLALRSDVSRETLPDSILRPEAPVSPAISTAVSIPPERLPAVTGGETGFRSAVFGEEAQIPAPKPFAERFVDFTREAVSRRPSEVRAGLNQLIDEALGVPEGDLEAGEILPQFLRAGGRVGALLSTLAPEIGERGVESEEPAPEFVRAEATGLAEMVLKALETGLSVADISKELIGIDVKTAKDVKLRKELLERPEETILGLSIAAAPFRGRVKPKGVERAVSEAPKPDVKKIRPKIEDKPPLGTARVKLAAPGRPAGAVEPTKRPTVKPGKEKAIIDKTGSEIADLKGRVPKVNADGTITLFHRTSKESAKKIKETGKFESQEQGKVFFSTQKEGQAKGFGDEIIEVKIKPNELSLEDAFPDGEIHLSASVKDIKLPSEKVSEVTKQKRISEISEQALKQKEAQKEAGITPADIKPKERIPTQLTPEPKTVKEAVKGIPVLSNKRIAEDLRTLGLEQFPKTKRQSLIESTKKAIQNKEDVNAVAIVTEKLKTRQPLSTSEQVGIALTRNKILPEYKQAASDFRRLRAEGKEGAAKLAQDRANALLGELRTLEEGARVLGGEEVARSLGVRGRLIDENIATVLLDAERIKGSRLSRPQTEKLEKAVTTKEATEQRVDAMLKKLETDLVENQQLTAEQFIKSENRKFSKRRTEARKENVRTKRADIKKQILSLGLERLNDITGVTVEGAFLIGKLALTYAEEAGLSLSQVVKKVREDYPQLSSSEVIEAINTKNPRRQRKARSDAAKQISELKTQARLLDDIRKAEEGVFAPGKTRVARSVEIKKLQKTLTELRKQAFKGVTEGAKLERALQTIDRLQDQLVNQFRDVKKKRKTDPAELKSAKEKIRSLQSDMRTVDALADVQEQLRTGDFKVREVVEREIPIEIQREQVKLKRARRQIRDIQESVAPVTPKKLGLEALNLARTIKATADMSATLRQGLVPAVHLIRKGEFGRLAKIQAQSIKSFFSEFTADQIDVTIRNADQHFIREQSGLFLAERGALRVAEENFMSKYAERIPGFGKIIRASDRHMTTSLNLLRTSMFDMFLEKFPNATPIELRAWADYVNAASGRGNLNFLGKSAEGLSVIFFAPRFAASRFQTPFKLIKNLRKPRVRNEIAKDMAAVLTLGTATLYLADLAGADVGLDPRESDWGKIVLPSVKGKAKTRIDIWAGFQQPARLITRTVLSATDRGGDIPASEIPDPSELVWRFLRFKAAPPINILEALVVGETVVGEPVTPTDVALKAIQPIILESTIEAYQREGFGAAGITAGLEFGGVSVSTFEDSKSRVRRDIRKLLKDGKRKEAIARARNWNLLNDQKIKSITVIKDGKATKVRVAP